MNKAITDGLALMPPAFSAGLDQWSNQDGTPGSTTLAGASNATLISGDPDFGSCLELVKLADVEKIRFMGETPVLPGCYLRVSARLKVLSGNLPSVRVAAWCGGAGGVHVAGQPETGPTVTPTAYGEIVEVSAIIGTGQRGGVDMRWSLDVLYAHVGLDLTGANGGTVRIESIRVEDVTHVYHRDMMDWIDVRDYGALGDGLTDDGPAIAAADAAAVAAGVELLVSEGSYYVAGDLTIAAPVRFAGRLIMPDSAVLSCLSSFDLPTYADAFGDEETGLRKAIQALFSFTDHDSLDLKGRRVGLTAPIDVHALAGTDSFSTRRVIRGGQIEALDSPDWASTTVTATANWSAADPRRLTGIANAAQIPVGARVSGAGVGREVYVNAVDAAAGAVTLSLPLSGAPASQSYSFTRDRYLLDFSGFTTLSRFVIDDVEFLCQGRASGVMLPRGGLIFHLRDCFFTAPRDRAVTSIGTGCQGMLIDRCQFLSNEQALPAQDRTTIAINANANDVKLRDNRAVRFRHFAVLAGTGAIITGNHFFQGDNGTTGLRTAGLVLTATNCKTTITGNYVDNCWIEWGNEHDPAPEQANEFSFGALSITGNIFTSKGSVPWFRFIVVKPRGAGHFINGLVVSGNTFKHIGGGSLARVEEVDASVADLDYGRMRNIEWSANTYHAIDVWTASPVTLTASATTPAAVWTLECAPHLPFGGRARNVVALVPEGAITDASGVASFVQPYAMVERGPDKSQIELHWPAALKGKVQVTVRVDNPL
ncbi:MAG: right-handed parallel beta-helix repeat-containing protein [Alphaproteobacteria bacterium]|nr:MAG: right-handed parallel beta-helix repeat-containing protein [Alphaproteobacteria bacterium]